MIGTTGGAGGAAGGPDKTGGWNDACVAGVIWVWVLGSATSGRTGGPICHAYSFEIPGPWGGGSGPGRDGALERSPAFLMSSEIRPTRGSKESRTLVSSAVSSACVASGSFPSSTNVRIVSSSFSCFLLFSRALNSTSAELNSWVTAVSGPRVTSVCFASSMASLNFSRLILTLMSRIRCSMALRV